MYPLYTADILSIDGQVIDQIDDIISLQAARAFNTAGSATLVIPHLRQRHHLFQMHMRMKLWRYDYRGIPLNFGDTLWFLKKKDHTLDDKSVKLEFVDAFAMLGTRVVAYTALTPYADKTLEELALVNYNDTLRTDNMMRAYMRENFGSLALDSNRLNPYLSIELDKNLGPYGEKQGAWQDLDSVISDLAKQAGANGLNLYYDLIPASDGTFVFRVWTKVRGVDRGGGTTVDLTLNDTDGTLADIHEIEDWTEVKTVCYALGYDSGPSQVIEYVESPNLMRQDPFGRIEMTINATDSDVPSVLRAAAQAALNGARAKKIVTARVVENNALRYGDILYGDVFSIEVSGSKYNVAINAINVTWNEAGEDLEIRLSGEEAQGVILTGGPEDPGIDIPGRINTAPVVDAGDDQTVAINEAAILTGSAVDDGFPDPPAALTYLWSMVSGPGTATFLDATDPTTEVEFDEIGTYILKLSASDSLLNGEDFITIEAGEFTPVPPNPDILRPMMENLGGMSQYHWYRTGDFQTRAIEGGPTWTRHDIAADDTEEILSFVINPFSAGYLTGTGEVNGFVVTHNKIIKATNLFGSVGRTDLHTFAVDLSDPSHWRTIAASFGAYFEEGENPWLMVTSYYGDTVGHTGTWVTYSMDGGTTWTAEVQVSAFYDTVLAFRQPIGSYLSPRTPGFALTAAYVTTASPGTTAGFASFDWGATWEQLVAPVDTPELPLPEFVPGGYGCAGLVRGSVESISGPDTQVNTLTIIPPVDAVRMLVRAVHVHKVTKDGGYSSAAGSIEMDEMGLVTRSIISEFHRSPTTGYNISHLDSYELEYTISPGASVEIYLGTDYGVDSVGGFFIGMAGMVTAYVREIELENGEIYEYGCHGPMGMEHFQAGSIHVPWPDNENEAIRFYGSVNRTAERLMTLRQNVGVTNENFSPNDGTRDFGINMHHFGVRTYDSDLVFAAVGGRGNTTTTALADDQVGLWLSENLGVTWENILAPVDESNVHLGLQIAFSGTDPTVLYAWGGWTDGALPAIWYTRDFGETLDSRQGDLDTLEDGAFGGHIAFIGIAGGPIDDEPAPPVGDNTWYGNPAYYYGDMKQFVLWDNTDILRCDDIQLASPTWARIDTGISGTLIDVQYVHIDEDSIGAYALTSAAVFWCADILAATPSWSSVLSLATVQASDFTPTDGDTVEFKCFATYDEQPGFLIVITGPIFAPVTPASYMHAYFWRTTNFGASWSSVDMTAFTFTSNSITRCYADAGPNAMQVFRKEPGTIWCVRNTSRTSTQTGDTGIFKSVDLGLTWTMEHTFGNWSNGQTQGSLLAPFPYLDSPGYIVRGTTTAANLQLWRSTDEFNNVTDVTTLPVGYEGGISAGNAVMRPSKRPFDDNHLLNILTDDGSNGDLFESFDQGATWSAALQDMLNDYVVPARWPPDNFQWVVIGQNGNGGSWGRIGLTMDGFASVQTRLGNLVAVLSGGAWANGLGNGFALPRVGNNS